MSHSNTSFWGKIMQVDWSYTTKLAVTECISALVNEEGTFGGDPLNLDTYHYDPNRL